MSAPTFIYPPASTGGTPVGGSGTTGTIPVWSSGTTLGDSLLSQSTTTGNAVFLGAASTAFQSANRNRFVINAPAAGTAFAVWLVNGTADGYISGDGSVLSVNGATGRALQLGANASTAVTVATSGNVGIGTVNPFTRLEVNSGTGTAPVLSIYCKDPTFAAGSTLGTLALGANTVGNNVQAATISGINVTGSSSADGAMVFSTRGSAVVAERMRIDSSGNVGIGTASPGSLLEASRSVNSITAIAVRNANAGATAQARLDVISDGGTLFLGTVSAAWSALGLSAGESYIWTSGAKAISFGTNSAERARITSTGNVHAASGTTTMTDGFFYIPAAAGAPTGVPTAIAGRVPMYYDTTNDQFYIRNGANWRKVTLT
jgi:hypothetical protein